MITVTDDSDLSGRNTFGLKVKCKRWIEYDSPLDIPAVLAMAGPQWMAIGGGSNMLFTHDYPGTLLHSAIKGIVRDDEVVIAGAGERLDDVVAWCCDRGIWGLENLSLIPGYVGGATVQNAGAYGAEIGASIKSVTAYDVVKGEFVEFAQQSCGFGYRQSLFKRIPGRYIISSVNLSPAAIGPDLTYGALSELTDDGTLTPSSVRAKVIEIRDSKLPRPEVVGSAGSFFKNPVVDAVQFDILRRNHPDIPHFIVGDGVKIPAAWLIDKAGVKSMKVGGASVWARQPLVIVNETGQATPQDILELEQSIIKAVKAEYDIVLQPEVEHI